MLATFSVTNLLDGPVTAPGDLPGSLRQAIFDANNSPGADDIDLTGVSGTLLMTDGEFAITEALNILGPGRDNADDRCGQRHAWHLRHGAMFNRIFTIDDGTAAMIDVAITGLTLTGGDTAKGANQGTRSGKDGVDGRQFSRKNI